MSVSQRESQIKKVELVPLLSKVSAPRLSSQVTQGQGGYDKPHCSRMLFSHKLNFDKQDMPSGSGSLFSKAGRLSLSIDVCQVSDSVPVPSHVLEAIWLKATELLNDSSAIGTVPGGGAKDRFVKSSSGNCPHMVKNGQYACDSDCPNWKSLTCKHLLVATAEKNGDLLGYVHWLQSAKRSPNLTKLVLSRMPKGRGRKGTVPQSRKTITEDNSSNH